MANSNGLFADYPSSPKTLDESLAHGNGHGADYTAVRQVFESLGTKDFAKLRENANVSFLNQGITYAVYSEGGRGEESIFPFDLYPRIIDGEEWSRLEQGLEQRCRALNLFLQDVYGPARILADKVVPAELIHNSAHYVAAMRDFTPPSGVYTHISGTDLVRHTDGEFYVLEDNLRSPSGVSYVLSNRLTLRRTLYDTFLRTPVADVGGYPDMLRETLESVSPPADEPPVCVVLTPGQYNSAYYEHTLLARRMAVELVQGVDLRVMDDDRVYMLTTRGPVRVHVIYRRIDDQFLDPETFRPDSMLGVPGLMRAYRRGTVTIVNAPGTGVADDKAVCAYVPDMIRYYLNQEPIIQNVRTYLCGRPDDRAYVLDHLAELVVKPTDMSGGYGVVIGEQATRAELDELAARIREKPTGYIAQPRIMLSTHPTFIEGQGFRPRHIDLRTFTLQGSDGIRTLRGGLTRVALREGSLIVNSSQGGGSKDTWVLDDHAVPATD